MGRYTLATPAGDLADRFGASPAEPLRPRYNIAPGDDLAVVRADAPGTIGVLEWGLLPGWVDDPDDAPRPINARAETVAGKPTFREAFAERRCLVLVDGFYDWADEPGRKQPYYVTRVDGEPFALAGIWEPRSGTGADTPGTVATLTTEPNAVVEPIHHRMPAILERDEESAWLDEGGERPLGPGPAGSFRAYPVSKAVNDPGNDGPELIEEADVGEQTGLSEFT